MIPVDRTARRTDEPKIDWQTDGTRRTEFAEGHEMDETEIADALVDHANSACTETTWLAEQARDGFLEDEQIEAALTEAERLVRFLRRFHPDDPGDPDEPGDDERTTG